MARDLLQNHRRLITRDLDEAREYVGRFWERHESTMRRGRSYDLAWHQADLRHSSLAYIRTGSTINVRCTTSDAMRICMPLSGQVRHVVDGQAVQTSTRVGVIYRPGQDLGLDVAPFSALLLTLRGAFVRAALERRFNSAGVCPRAPDFPFDVPAANSLRSLCSWLADELDRPGTALLASARAVANLEKAALALLLDTFEVMGAAPQPGEDAGAAQLRRMEEYLDAHFASEIGVEDVAAAADINVRAAQTVFRRLRDQTPTEALLRRRLLHARHLLATGAPSMTVTIVAYDVGLFHLGRFATRYKEMFGERPSETLARTRRSAELTPVPRRIIHFA